MANDNETQATQNNTQANNDNTKSVEKNNEVKKTALDLAKELLARDKESNEIAARRAVLDMEYLSRIGQGNEARKAALDLIEKLNSEQAALTTTQQQLVEAEEELNALRQKGNDLTDEEKKKIKELEKDVVKFNKSVEQSSKFINDNNEAFEKAEKVLKKYGEISKNDQKAVDSLSKTFESMTMGLISMNAAQEHSITKFGLLISEVGKSDNIMQVLKESIGKVFNPLNIAAELFDTVKDATKNMAQQFDQAQAKFTAVTGVAKQYNAVLYDVQKQGNRFGITAAEGGDAMASLLAGFNDFHRSAPGVQKDLAIGVAGLNKLGVSSSETASLLNNLNKIMGQSGTQALATTKKIGMMGTAIGISTSKMLKDYNASLKTLAVYGDKSIEVFTGIAAAAKAAGVETGTLLGLADKFDTFSGAAETTGKLNAILGSQLSATEMLTMSEDERIKTLISSVQATGQAFGSMDKFTQKAIASAAGISDMAEANRIFGMSMSEYESYEDQMKSSADSQKQFEEAMKNITPVLEKLKLLAAQMAANFAPVLETIGNTVQTMVDTFADWDEASGGMLGTIIGGVTGLLLFGSAVSGVASALNNMWTASKNLAVGIYSNIKAAGIWLGQKLGLIATTTAETTAETANTIATTANTGAELANTAATVAGTAADIADTTQEAIGTGTTIADTTAKIANTTATGANTVATKAATTASAGAIPVMLALGAAVLMIGGGIYLAATGLANFIGVFKGMKPSEFLMASIAVAGLAYGFVALGVALGALIYSGVGPAAVPVLLGIGAAVFLIGAAVGIAASGFALMIGAIAIPSVEQYLAFGASMLMFAGGLYLSAGAMGIFVPLFGTFMAALMVLAVNPIAWLAVGLLGAVAGSIFMIGLGAKLAIDSMTELISTIASSEGLGDIIGGLFGSVEDSGISDSVIQRVTIVRQLLSDVKEADVKSELENIALITTGVSAGLMTQNTVSNLVVVSALADTIKNIFNPEITIEMDSGAVEKLFKEGVYKVNRST